jgi:hypothetical protein
MKRMVRLMKMKRMVRDGGSRWVRELLRSVLGSGVSLR